MNTMLGAEGPKERPIFTAANCVNRRQRKFTCTVCHELCPEGVFSMDPRKPLEWDKCTNCGICVSACPSRAFAPGPEMQKTYTGELELSKPISFSCFKEKQLCTKTVDCVAGVPWELYAALALHTDIVIYVGNCASCEREGCYEQILKNLESLRLFIGEEKYSERVHVLKSGKFVRESDNDADKMLSRREIFADVKKTLVKSAYKAAAARLPFLDPAEQDGLQYRRLLSGVVSKRREDIKKAAASSGVSNPALPQYELMLPRYTVNCYGCGICEKVCPHKAIETGTLENGKRLIYITPWKCTACTVCTHACPYGGLNGLKPVTVPFMERLPLVRVSSAACSKCGMTIKPDTESGMCVSCTAKYSRKIR